MTVNISNVATSYVRPSHVGGVNRTVRKSELASTGHWSISICFDFSQLHTQYPQLLGCATFKNCIACCYTHTASLCTINRACLHEVQRSSMTILHVTLNKVDVGWRRTGSCQITAAVRSGIDKSITPATSSLRVRNCSRTNNWVPD